jgi:hypothetical protein
MSEPGCGPSPIGVIGIIADLGTPIHMLEDHIYIGVGSIAYFRGPAKPMATILNQTGEVFVGDRRRIKKKKKRKSRGRDESAIDKASTGPDLVGEKRRGLLTTPPQFNNNSSLSLNFC